MTNRENCFIVTAGANYLDIDAYACLVAMAELLQLKGKNAIAYSTAKRNYSVCKSLRTKGKIFTELPLSFSDLNSQYIIVDVSDPDYFERKTLFDNVIAVYDHHVGFEEYWANRIGENAHIEFIGAAATLIYREWKKAGIVDRMESGTSKLLIAAILDNTLNLTSSITTKEDVEAFNELCKKENIGKDWCALYFSEVQANVEANLRNALFGDVKIIQNNLILPSYIGQVTVWNVDSILSRLAEIMEWFSTRYDNWMLNIIDIQNNCSYFVCNSKEHQKKVEKVFGGHFNDGVAKISVSYLRKEMLKKTVF